MTAETTTETTPRARPFPWRWLLFGLGLVALVVFLTMAAMDRRNVVWEEGKPLCPHCRTDVPQYSGTCPTCRQGYDWTSHEHLCRLCLTEHDVERIRAIPSDELEAAVRAAAGDDAAKAEAILSWLREIEPGECTYCGGTGDDLFAAATGDEDLSDCPVCLGEGECLMCDGDEKVRQGDADAHRSLLTYRERLENLEGRLGHPNGTALRDLIEDMIPRLRGYEEIRHLGDGSVVDEAAKRRDEVLRLIPRP